MEPAALKVLQSGSHLPGELHLVAEGIGVEQGQLDQKDTEEQIGFALKQAEVAARLDYWQHLNHAYRDL